MLNYLINSNDNVNCLESDMKFKWVDDLTILELVLFGSLITEYDCQMQVPSDIGIEEKYLPPQTFNTQDYLNSIQLWTDTNLMKLNDKKCNYMVFTRSPTEIATRLSVNSNKLLTEKGSRKC